MEQRQPGKPTVLGGKGFGVIVMLWHCAFIVTSVTLMPGASVWPCSQCVVTSKGAE
jgi:hypothetical protein